MIAAGGYVLLVPENRRERLIFENEVIGRHVIGEPVPEFDHSRRAPLIILATFEDGAITHIASGKKGTPGSGGTRMVRLNLKDMQALKPPIQFADLIKKAPNRVKPHLERVLKQGGLLPPKTLAATIDVLLEIVPNLDSRLARFSARRDEVLRRITPRQKENLAVQKETVSVALRIAGMDTEEVLSWTPAAEGRASSFLEGLPGAILREDAMIIADFNQLPGFDAVRDTHFAVKEFVDQRDEKSKLVIFMANRLPLEQQTGADLIYYHEHHNSFVFVQYKAMNKEGKEAVFRWQAGDQLTDEIARMDKILEELEASPADASPQSFRMHTNPFFLKVCPRQVFNPDDKGLFPGMYFPLDLWKCLAADPVTLGKQGGRFLTYGNATRRLGNSEFVMLVAGGWVGTTVPQSAVLKRVIQAVLETNKTVTFAIKRKADPVPEAAPEPTDEEDGDDDARTEDLLALFGRCAGP